MKKIRRALRILTLGAGASALLIFLFSCVLPAYKKPDASPSYVKVCLIRKNPYSRPGKTLDEVKNIVIHYVANPGSSAEANRDYFDNLRKFWRNRTGTKASSHFIVGLSGEVIQCIPTYEIAYANYPRNGDTISIEVCHPDETGEFSPVTKEALTELVSDLCISFGLTENEVIRHYDVSGKNCPKFYVENEEAYEELIREIGNKIKEKQPSEVTGG